MRAIRLLVALIATLTVLAGAPSGAAAAPINECGTYPRGAQGYSVFNITTRVTSCRKARRMARNYYRGRWTNIPRGYGRLYRRGSYTCQSYKSGYEGSDTRCTASGGRVVRWQASS